MLRVQRERGDGDAFRDRPQHHGETDPLGFGADDMLAVPFVVPNEDAGERDIVWCGAVGSDVGCDPSRKRDPGGCKIISAERCSARLSGAGVEPWNGSGTPGCSDAC